MDKKLVLSDVVAGLKFTDTMNALLSKIVAPDAVSVIPSKSEKTGVEGIKIYGIQCFNESQLLKDEDFSALNDEIASSPNHRLLIRHSKEYGLVQVLQMSNPKKKSKRCLLKVPEKVTSKGNYVPF